MIRKPMARFQENGSVINLPPTGRSCLVRSEGNIERVRATVEEEHETSTRRHWRQLGMSRTSLRRILNNELKTFPYKIQVVQWTTTCIEVMGLASKNQLEKPSNQLITNDAAHFKLNGFVSQQNCRFWNAADPRRIHQRQLDHLKCTIWCEVTSQEVIEPSLKLIRVTVCKVLVRDMGI